MPKLSILEQPFITPKGKVLDGIEKVVTCPISLCKVNVKKNCSKCLSKKEINYKESYVLCKKA